MAKGVKLTCLDCGQANRVPEGRLSASPKCGTCGAKLLSDKVIEVEPTILAKAVKTDDIPLVVDFWAPWCGPCRMMTPEYAKAAGQLKGRVRLVKLNTQDHPDAGTRHNIRGIPTMAAFSKGREAARQSGAMQASGIVNWVVQSVPAG